MIHNGPVFVDEDYELTREIVGEGETPRAEFVWTRTLLWERRSGKLGAEMTLQSLNVKSTFPDYDNVRREYELAVKARL